MSLYDKRKPSLKDKQIAQAAEAAAVQPKPSTEVKAVKVAAKKKAAKKK